MSTLPANDGMAPFAFCRLLMDPEPNSGAWNMAVDELLFESAIQDQVCSLRIYRWAEATISLGYFQAYRDYEDSPHWSRFPVVRRLTGGGAILHHLELTYSCTLPREHPYAAEPGRLYDRIHAAIRDVLSQRGFPVGLRGQRGGVRTPGFLCFGRSDPRDILLREQKIVGSAQRRRRGAVLQHGSLLLKRSAHAPQFAGACDLVSGSAGIDRLEHDLAFGLGAVLGRDYRPEALTSVEEARVRSLHEQRYTCKEWNGRF